MLRKLIKYDFISINKDLILLYVVCLLLSFVVILCNGNSNDGIIATKKICTDLSLVGMFLVIVIPFIKLILRIRNTLFKEESYLYLTLPVKRGTLYDSRIIVSIITLLISWIVLCICFINVFSGKNAFAFVSQVIDSYNGIGDNILFVLSLAVQASLIFMSLVVGLLLGQKMDHSKDLFTFLFGMIIYVLIRLSVEYFYELNVNMVSIAIVLIADIILFSLGRYIFNKGIDVD